ncbi:MAG: N-acetyl-gamma-glutamyl-phosphate reductase [Candidatus Omnitrophica bacterium]|nr:N-acetyl-gamma-glutamyl-phosphate reductase [Candidatus Omnitrophota bacterium]
MIRVGVVGATGYTGEELLRLLLQHPQAAVTSVSASAKMEHPMALAELYPRFGGRLKLFCTSLNINEVAAASDLVFLALPHGTAMEVAPDFLRLGKKVIDLSGDFRLKDAALYERWYGFTHAAPELLRESVYGLTEYFRPQLQTASLVANPGCYPTSILLAILPLYRKGWITDGGVIADAKSGITGAGRKAERPLLFAEANENLRAYKLNAHQHLPEMTEICSLIAGRPVTMTFVPHVVPLNRGMLSTLYVTLRPTRSSAEVAQVFEDAYGRERFVRVRANGTLPEIRDVVETNYCDIGYRYDEASGQLILVSVIDNLTKGAAGQAIQNMNVMYGLDETLGLV